MIKQLLNNPIAWEASRTFVNCAFGVYQKRLRLMHDYGLIDGNPSIIDIGCGSGQYANVTYGKYLGIDLESRYIDYARRRNRFSNHLFRSADASTIANEEQKFDIALMVDFLHHISDEQCVNILNSVKRIAKRYIIIFEPVSINNHSLLGRFMAMCERGEHVRSSDKLCELLKKCELEATHNIALSFGPVDSKAIIICVSGELW